MFDSLINLLSVNFFPLAMFSAILFLFFLLIFSTQKSHYIIYGLLLWYPLENFIFNYVPIDLFVFFKYFPELILYITLIISWILYVRRTGKFFPSTPLNLPLALFILASIVSLIINHYSPTIWILGLRQLLRFVAVFLIVVLEDYDDDIVKQLLIGAGAMMAFEAMLGLMQYLAGGRLDKYLFFSGAFGVARDYLGDLPQFWAPGTRVFGTLGRYDQLGSFLLLGLVLLLSWIYILPKEKLSLKKWRTWILGLAFLGVSALLLTSSRASWIGFLGAVLFLGWIFMRDKRVIKLFGILAAVGALYLGIFAVTYEGNILNITDKPKTSLGERVVEIFSPASLRNGYNGYGRVFFIINTPLKVVRYSPLFGVGLGNYGGGVAASLNNTRVYDMLNLPFGIQNFYGQIDNNWMAIWGESGTVGLILWIWILFSVAKTSEKVSLKSKEKLGVFLGRALLGITVGVAILGCFGPYFEFRSLMFYFWLLAGLMFLYYRRHKNDWNFLKI